MQGHTTGCQVGNRRGSILSALTFLFCSTGVANGNVIATGSNQKLCTLPANLFNPILYTVRIVEIAANTATGAVTASIGTVSAGTQLINAVDLKGTAGVNYTTANARVYAEADVDIWLNYTVASGTDAAGKFVVQVEAYEVNTQPL